MDYEKGSPRNLVQFSEYNDLAFTDTGININDNSGPSPKTLWTSDKIDKRLHELVGMNSHMDSDSGHGEFDAGVQVRLPRMLRPYGPKSYYPNGYVKYFGQSRYPHVPRLFKPSWWLSWIVRSRKHYCDKCCNYMDHFWSNSWKDDPSLAKHPCSCTKPALPALPALPCSGIKK